MVDLDMSVQKRAKGGGAGLLRNGEKEPRAYLLYWPLAGEGKENRSTRSLGGEG